jgi:hypothetical protein
MGFAASYSLLWRRSLRAGATRKYGHNSSEKLIREVRLEEKAIRAQMLAGEDKRFKVHPLSYHKKSVSALGREEEANDVPLQVVFPTGQTGIAMPTGRSGNAASRRRNQTQTFDHVAVAAATEHDMVDKMKRVRLTIAFEVMCLANLIITGLLFANADVSDLTKVEEGGNNGFHMPNDFTKVPEERRDLEKYVCCLTQHPLIPSPGTVTPELPSHHCALTYPKSPYTETSSGARCSFCLGVPHQQLPAGLLGSGFSTWPPSPAPCWACLPTPISHTA